MLLVGFDVLFDVFEVAAADFSVAFWVGAVDADAESFEGGCGELFPGFWGEQAAVGGEYGVGLREVVDEFAEVLSGVDEGVSESGVVDFFGVGESVQYLGDMVFRHDGVVVFFVVSYAPDAVVVAGCD